MPKPRLLPNAQPGFLDRLRAAHEVPPCWHLNLLHLLPNLLSGLLLPNLLLPEAPSGRQESSSLQSGNYLIFRAST